MREDERNFNYFLTLLFILRFEIIIHIKLLTIDNIDRSCDILQPIKIQYSNLKTTKFIFRIFIMFGKNQVIKYIDWAFIFQYLYQVIDKIVCSYLP